VAQQLQDSESECACALYSSGNVAADNDWMVIVESVLGAEYRLGCRIFFSRV
jgi:hypothetical protein